MPPKKKVTANTEASVPVVERRPSRNVKAIINYAESPVGVQPRGKKVATKNDSKKDNESKKKTTKATKASEPAAKKGRKANKDNDADATNNVEIKEEEDASQIEAPKPEEKKSGGRKKAAPKAKSVPKTKEVSNNGDKKLEVNEEEENNEMQPSTSKVKPLTNKGVKRKANQEVDPSANATKPTKSKRAAKPKEEGKETDNVTELVKENLNCNRQSNSGQTWNIKICSWNVDGIRAWFDKKGVDFLRLEDPDIICLQETRCPQDKLPDLDLPGYHRYCKEGENKGYAGVAIYTKRMVRSVEYSIGEEFDTEDRIAVVEYQSFYLVCVYVPNAGRGLVTLDKRLKWNTAFSNYIKKLDSKKPVIICGDMNVAHTEIDLANPKSNKKNAGFTIEERQGMTDFLALGFTDSFRFLYPDQKGAYTFWSYMKNSRSKNVGWRLDYFLVSNRISEHICDTVIRSSAMGSDHCPITLFIHDRTWPERV